MCWNATLMRCSIWKKRRSPLESGSNRLALGGVPLYSAAEAVFEVHQDLVSQMLFRLADVGERMLDVAAALGSIFD
jgi:hypothetical protein